MTMDEIPSEAPLAAFERFRKRLAFVTQRRMNPLLSSRISVEDVLQEAYLAATRRETFLRQEPGVPLYFKFRRIVLQTLADLEREHIRSEKRSTMKEVACEASEQILNGMRAQVRSPKTILARKERFELIRRTISALPDTDRQIIVLRNFDELSNQECAEILGIDQKAASIRYVRALARLRERLQTLSEFTP